MSNHRNRKEFKEAEKMGPARVQVFLRPSKNKRITML